MSFVWMPIPVDRSPDSGPLPGAEPGKIRELEQRLDRLELICESLWTLAKERMKLTDDDLMAVIAELDLSDGVADGKKARLGPAVCTKCNRPNSRRHDFCIYCGHLIRTKPF